MDEHEPDHDGVPHLIPARMLNEFVYCPRLFYLEWVDAEWMESADTLSGARVHRRVDKPTASFERSELSQRESTRSVELCSEEEGLIARLDILEGHDGEVVPVDYKRGKVPPSGVPWDADRIQVGVQALLLQSAGHHCREAAIHYAGSRRRITIPVNEALLHEVRSTVIAARETAARDRPPAPLVDSPKCVRCSLAPICLPDETLAAGAEEGSEESSKPKRVLVAAPDALPLHVLTPGARIGKDGEGLVVKNPDGQQARVRLIDISQVCLFGPVSISAQALAALLRRDVPICHFSSGAWFQGLTHSIGSRNAAVRMAQYRASQVRDRALELAQGFAERKIRNQRTLLRRNHSGDVGGVLHEMKLLARRVGTTQNLDELRGVEGAAARAFFGAFSGMLRDVPGRTFDFNGRNRRPPRDPVNAMLSFAYSMLAKDWTATCYTVGLDPFIGIFHAHRFGRAALALDLMEEFRPLIADSVVIQVVNNGEVNDDSFVTRGDAVALTDSGRRKFIAAYERRMAHEVTHPVFKYRISYRRLLEVQARLFARCLRGEIATYDGFITR